MNDAVALIVCVVVLGLCVAVLKRQAGRRRTAGKLVVRFEVRTEGFDRSLEEIRRRLGY